MKNHIDWDIKNLPDKEQRDKILKAMQDYCVEVERLVRTSKSVGDVIRDTYGIYRIMICLLKHDNVSNTEIKRCRKFFKASIKDARKMEDLKCYYPEIEMIEIIYTKCLQWISEYKRWKRYTIFFWCNV